MQSTLLTIVEKSRKTEEVQEMTARLTVIHDPHRHPDNDVETA
jgi:hypothetical protein